LSLGFCNHSPPCPRCGLRRCCTSGVTALTPPGAPSSMFYIDGGRSRTFSSGTSWIPNGDRWWPLPEIPAAPPRGPAIDVFNFSGGRCRPATPTGAHHRRLQLRWWPLSDMSAAPPGVPPSMSPTLVVATAGHVDSTPRGPSLMPSTSVVAAIRHADGTPQGAHH
jgi:hypothetical protein